MPSSSGSTRKTLERQVDADQLCINTIRCLSIDAIQKAHSGHPGMPMGAAPTVYCLWQKLLRFDPEDPSRPNRDRFVLSIGHASAMLYSFLYLFGCAHYAGPEGAILGMHTFGLSAPMKIVQNYFGFLPEQVVAAAKQQLKRHPAGH